MNRILAWLASLASFGMAILGMLHFRTKAKIAEDKADEHEKIAEVKDDQLEAAANRPTDKKSLIDRIRDRGL